MDSMLPSYVKQSLKELFNLGESSAHDCFEQEMITTVNYLIAHDFNKLISVLYRVDVSEKQLRTLLGENNGENAGTIITRLLIERQVKKFENRAENSTDIDIPPEDKW